MASDQTTCVDGDAAACDQLAADRVALNAAMDALKGIGGAAEGINDAADPCEPYAVALEVEHVPPCGTSQGETTLFPDVRSESREVNYKDATISVTGKCNVTEPTVTRA